MGGLVGWSWLLPPYQWAFGAVCATEVKAFQFNAQAVRDRCAADPALKDELTRRLFQHALAGHWGGPVPYPGVADLTMEARDAAQQETGSVLKKTGKGPRPPSVTVRAVTGLPAGELLSAAAGADMIVVGSRAAPASGGC